MNKKIFNIRLFWDAVKQLRIIGITAFVILCIEAILIPIGNYISHSRQIADNSNGFPMVYTFMDVHFLLIASFVVIAPLMTLYLFNFLNKRNASDFYHSIPHTRTCLYFSYFGGIVFWLLLNILGSSFIAIIASLFMKEFYIINTLTIIITIFNIFAGSIFVAACVAVAMCITGTLFNNIIVSGIIIFVPRFMLAVIISTIASITPIISSDHIFPLLATKYNVVTGFIFTLVTYGNRFTEPLVNIYSGIYTIIMAIILMCIGSLLFKIRKSESAGFSAPNNYLQAAYRIIIALLICFAPICMIFSNIVQKEDLDADTLFGYITFYIIALFAYFIYELITTKKWRNLIKSVPALLILAILNVVIILSMVGVYKSIMNFTPDAEDIDTIQIISEESSYNIDQIEYFTKATEEIKIDNDMINQVIAKSLKNSITLLNESPNDYYNKVDSTYVKTIAIQTGSKVHYRKIFISSSDYSIIANELEKIEKYKEVYLNLPELGKNNTTIYFSNVDLDDEARNKIYEIYRNEVAKMSFGEWFKIINSQNSEEISSNTLDTIHLTSSIGIHNYTASLPIPLELTETCNAYLQEVNSNNLITLDEFINLVFNADEHNQFSLTITPFHFNNYQYGYSLFWYSNVENNLELIDDELLQDFKEIIEKELTSSPNINDNFIAISAWITNGEGYPDKPFNLYLNISDEDIETVNKFLNRLK